MLKLSQFGASKKFIVKNRDLEEVDDLLNGESVELFNLGSEELSNIENATKEKDNSGMKYALALIENLTNIEVDIEEGEFKRMFNRPSAILVKLIDLLTNHMNTIKEESMKINLYTKNIDDNLEKLGITKELIEQTQKLEEVKTKQQSLNQVNLELESCEDLSRYKELQSLKAELEKEVELND